MRAMWYSIHLLSTMVVCFPHYNLTTPPLQWWAHRDRDSMVAGFISCYAFNTFYH